MSDQASSQDARLTPPWRGPVRVLNRRDGWGEVVDAEDRLIATCVLRQDADAIAARLNAAPGCGCAALIRSEAGRWERQQWLSKSAADVVRAFAACLPAPAASDDGASTVRENDEKCGAYCGGIPRMGIAYVCAKPKGHDGEHDSFVPNRGLERIDLRDAAAALAAKDAEIARLTERLVGHAQMISTVAQDRNEAKAARDAALAAEQVNRDLLSACMADLARVTAERDAYRDKAREWRDLWAGGRQWGPELWLACWMVGSAENHETFDRLVANYAEAGQIMARMIAGRTEADHAD